MSEVTRVWHMQRASKLTKLAGLALLGAVVFGISRYAGDFKPGLLAAIALVAWALNLSRRMR